MSTPFNNLSDERRNELKEELAEIMQRRFTHRDFTVLSRPWKLATVDQVAEVMLQIIDLEIEYYKQNGCVV